MNRLASLLLCTIALSLTRTSAATPYEVAVLVPEQLAVIRIDLDSGQQITIPNIPLDPDRRPLSLLATDAAGTIFVQPEEQCCVIPPGQLARFSTLTGRWENVSTNTTADNPNDMHALPNGNLLIGTESNVYTLDPQTGMVEFPFRGPLSSGPFMVAGNSVGDMATSGFFFFPTTVWLKHAGVETPEQIVTDALFQDYAFDSDNTLIGIGISEQGQSFEQPSLIKTDLRDGKSQVVFDDAILSGVSRLVIDPDGRIITMKSFAGQPSSQLVRIDLVTGLTETFDIDAHFIDLDILLVPEPGAWLLLVTGILCLHLMCGSSSQRRARRQSS